jgi:hypothetical protein
MKLFSRVRLAGLAFLILAFGASVARGQQEPAPAPETTPEATAEPSEPAPSDAEPGATPQKTRRWGSLSLEIGAWRAETAGADFVPTAELSTSTLNGVTTNTLTAQTLDLDKDYTGYLRLGITLPEEYGTLYGSYRGFSAQTSVEVFQPGDFVFAELQVVPFGAGAFDNGFADAYESDARIQLRDFQFGWERSAFNAPHFRSRWHAGLRGVFTRREMTSTYIALNPPPDQIPPLATPGARPDLNPLPDSAHILSEFDGTGVDVGMDFLFPFDKKGTFSIEAGFDLAVLWGQLTTQYSSLTHSYAVVRDDVVVEYIDAPFEEFLAEDPESETGAPLVNSIEQIVNDLNLNDPYGHSGATVLEAYLGFRVRLWPAVTFAAGYRDARYGETTADTRISTPSIAPGGTANFATKETTGLAPAFRGFYASLGFTY